VRIFIRARVYVEQNNRNEISPLPPPQARKKDDVSRERIANINESTPKDARISERSSPTDPTTCRYFQRRGRRNCLHRIISFGRVRYATQARTSVQRDNSSKLPLTCSRKTEATAKRDESRIRVRSSRVVSVKYVREQQHRTRARNCSRLNGFLFDRGQRGFGNGVGRTNTFIKPTKTSSL